MSEEYFKAIEKRDPSYDGKFYYGVITTGVYCKPSCPSRAALRENMRLFDTCEDAEKQDLRPCKKCNPRDDNALDVVIKYIEDNSAETIKLEELADLSGLSRHHLQRKFKNAYGVSPKEYQNGLRLKQFKSALKDGDDISGALYDAGYGSSSRIYEQIDGRIGMTPKAYRDGGKGEEISYAIRPCSLGLIIMAATDRGVCMIHFGDNENELISQLRTEYPNAELIGTPNSSDIALNDWIEAFERHISHGAKRPDIPLHLNGTAFQIKVWRFLMSVKPGEVISYKEQAERMGMPKAVRAVASANARNNIGVLIPCHRVLRGDGSLGGFRWGLDRKRALIDQERRKGN
ncbi:bifunctional transcriptional activator/DNA repair enzyme AdaA [Pseudemcibacter aquimaris]|uniref:bifunctional transcriptional activator/DNA repair enzyme AdaA n=1 Tax=Pseudemcibacter aquimaris TaxID=2857064 RepID=UPI0020110DBC|nr:methylated-DNA--[protein]-cysteine S-methyltransferase [Pseudemcibacter aquimaris]MCC3859622.1 methylated-DNA--[protein]-cysteine S-methyltransferase [Pseudemcibacter aquimaris]WDU60017.1 methylated-DNA--[protein]-cysteine S-methyltransferase [Pseudemcibacter aquimaris]